MKNIILKRSLFFILLIILMQVAEVSPAQAMKRAVPSSSVAEKDEVVSSPRKRMTFTVRNPLYDTTFKLAFIQPECMIGFLNSIYNLERGKRIQEIRYLTQELPGRVLDSRSIIFDIHCQTEEGETFIVEMQKAFIEGMMKRLELYSASALVHQWSVYSANLVSGSKEASHKKRYAGLQPVRP